MQEIASAVLGLLVVFPAIVIAGFIVYREWRDENLRLDNAGHTGADPRHLRGSGDDGHVGRVK